MPRQVRVSLLKRVTSYDYEIRLVVFLYIQTNTRNLRNILLPTVEEVRSCLLKEKSPHLAYARGLGT